MGRELVETKATEPQPSLEDVQGLPLTDLIYYSDSANISHKTYATISGKQTMIKFDISRKDRLANFQSRPNLRNKRYFYTQGAMTLDEFYINVRQAKTHKKLNFRFPEKAETPSFGNIKNTIEVLVGSETTDVRVF